MNNKIMIAGATVAAAIATYLIKRMKTSNRPSEAIAVKKSHHLTDVFAKAKNHSK